MAVTLPLSGIESPVKPENTRTGDNSFEEKLNDAQKELETKKNYLSAAPWRQLQDLFSIFPLDFDFKVEKTSTDLYSMRTQEEKPRQKTSPAREEKQNNNPTAAKEKTFATNDVKTVKEILNKFIPNPVAASYLPILGTTAGTSLTATKFDLQVLIDQIVEQARLIKTQKIAELSLVLQESELGQIFLDIASRNGLVTIQITASADTKKNLENSLKELEDALELADIKADKIKIVEVKDGLFYPRS